MTTVLSFEDESGYTRHLEKLGFLATVTHAGRTFCTVTDRGREVLSLHGPGSGHSIQVERVARLAIVLALVGGPAKLHELPGGFNEKNAVLRQLKIDGLVETDGSSGSGETFSLTSRGKVLGAEAVEAARSPTSLDAKTCSSSKSKRSSGARTTLRFDDILKACDRAGGGRWAMLRGQVLERLRAIPSGCIDLVIVSPPYYKYRDYGPGQMGNEPTSDLFVEGQIDVLAELKRVLSPRGLIWYVIQDKQEDRQLLGTTHDIVYAARKRLGLILAKEIPWGKDASLAATGELVMAHEFIFVFAKTADYYWNDVMSREIGSRGAARIAKSVQFFPHSKQTWQDGHDAVFPIELVQFALRCSASFYGRCWCGELWENVTVVEERDQERKVKHVAAARRVMGPSARCGHKEQPEPILVLDSFAGTATTGVATLTHGNARFLGIENNEKYFSMASKNLSFVCQEAT